MRRKTMIIPAGSILHHGTAWVFDHEDLQAPAWFSRSLEVARQFATRSDGETRRILVYRTTADIELPLIDGRHAFDDFCEEHGIRPYSAEDMADGVRQAGLAGWLIPDNYPDGDDILLVNISLISFEYEVK